MVDQELVASWKRTTAHLRAARAGVPELPADSDRWFNEYLAHNELQLAFEVLAKGASEAEASRDCWSALSRAADEKCLEKDNAGVLLVKKHAR